MATANGDGHHSNSSHQNKPRLIFWELTKGCNLRCIHCRASATELSSPDDLSTESAKAIIDQIAEVSNPILVLSGGEPLFRKDIFELAQYGTKKGLRVALATNGTLVTKEVARKIAASGVKRIAISLDGADAPTHDTFRGIPGAFDAALIGFRNLKELGLSVQINTTIARHNAHQLPNVLDLARSIGADALHTFLLVPVGCGVDIAAEQICPTRRVREDAELVLRSIARRRNRIEGHLRSPLFPRGPATSRGRASLCSRGRGCSCSCTARAKCS